MFLKMVSVAVLALTAGMGAANAQSAKDFGGPRELPPASYKGQQYVDSRGCVFLRAGLGGKTNWVPRVSRNRKQLCGYPPSGGKVEVAEDTPPRTVAPKVAAPAKVVAPVSKPSNRRPIDTVASITTPPRIRAANAPPQQRVAATLYAPPPVQQTPRVVVTPKAPQGAEAKRVPTQGKYGCYTNAPVAERFAVRGGGTVVMCTRGDGDLTHARAPRLPGGRAAVAASGFVESERRAAPKAAGTRRVAISTQDVVIIPKGYKKAWEDDRLNPLRGKGTAKGWYDQDGVWTRDAPAQLVDQNAPRGTVQGAKPRTVSVSSKSEDGQSGSYVQVGTFGKPSNAQGASSRLAGMGLPVAQQRINKGGKALQVVLAGPFASGSEAHAALIAARRAGFSDAFVR